jgi:hypothetical protein
MPSNDNAKGLTLATPTAIPGGVKLTVGNFNVGGGQQFELGPALKMLGLKDKYAVNGKVVDFSKMQLLYYPTVVGGSMSNIGMPITRTNFLPALLFLSSQYPALGDGLLAYYGLNAESKSTDVTDVFNNFIQNGYDFSKTPPPFLASDQAQIKQYQTYIKNQIQSGIIAGQYSATASQQANAIDNLQNTIETWNYNQAQKDFLTNVMLKLVTHEGDHVTNQNALLAVLRGQVPSGLGTNVDKQIRQDYENAYPGLSAYNTQPGAERMSESQYSSYASKIMDEATQYGAPMPTNQQIGQLLNHHVSAAEYSQRVTDIYAAVSNADPYVKKMLEKEFNVTPGQLMHYFMDPNVALQTMQRNVATADIQDYERRIGLNQIGLTDNEQLAQMAKLAGTAGNQGLGYGVSQIENSLLTASRDVALTSSLPGASNPTVNSKTLVASQLAGFGGINQVAAQTQVARAEEAKVAPFEKGGGYAESAKGVIGVGSART